MAVLTPLGRQEPEAAQLTDVGSAVAQAAAGGGPSMGTAVQGLAPGFTAAMTTRSTADDLRGLSGTTCAAPGTEFWFVGSGAVVGQRGRIYLSNPEPVPAVVDVTLYGPTGPLEVPSARGVTVAAGRQEVLKLDALAPDVTRFGIHIQVRQGRVAAAVRDQQVSGLTPRGADWLPQTLAPARQLVLPDVAQGAGERQLQIVVPGDSDAIVKVRLLGVGGSFVPSGLDVVEARAGRVTQIDLQSYAGGQPVAVALFSDQPLTAGLLSRAQGGTGPLTDIAYTAAAPALSPAAPGVVPALRGSAAGATVHSRLLLAAPDGAAKVEVALLPPASAQPKTFIVPQGSQIAVDASDLSTAADFAVSLRPLSGSGPVMAASELSDADPTGPMVTASVVRPGRYAVEVPSVVADLSTGLRPR
jgi:hypothetical protein